MQKPDAVAHMMWYGFVYGHLLSMLYIAVGIAIWTQNIDLFGIISAFVPSFLISLITGALSGVLIGFIDGCVLGFLTHRIYPPIDVIGFRQWRNLSYLIIGSLTLVGMGCFTFPVAAVISGPTWSETYWSNILWFSLPVPISMFTAVYIVHHYFLQLGAWGNVGKAKNKAKHSLTNQLAYDDYADENVIDEDVVQQKKNG